VETTDNMIIVRYTILLYSDELFYSWWILLFAETFISPGRTSYILFPECGNFRQKLQNRPRRVLQLVRPFVRRATAAAAAVLLRSHSLSTDKSLLYFMCRRGIDLCYVGMGRGTMIMGAGRVIAKVSSSVCVSICTVVWHLNFSMEKNSSLPRAEYESLRKRTQTRKKI